MRPRATDWIRRVRHLRTIEPRCRTRFAARRVEIRPRPAPRPHPFGPEHWQRSVRVRPAKCYLSEPFRGRPGWEGVGRIPKASEVLPFGFWYRVGGLRMG